MRRALAAWALAGLAYCATSEAVELPELGAPAAAQWAPAGWSTDDKVLYGLAQALNLADWAQTRDIVARRSEGYYEVNPILGRYPSMGRVNVMNGLTVIGTHLAAVNASPLLRRVGLTAYVTVKAGFVGHNASIGLHFRY